MKPIHIVPEMMDAMSKTFKDGMEALQDALMEMTRIANAMDDGALQGDAGSSFSDALQNSMARKIQELHDKFEELANDIEQTKQTFIDKDNSTQIGF